jgi:hypothetical protein
MAKAKRPSQKLVHRNLHVVSPLMKGPDIRALQLAINKELSHRKLAWRGVKVDGRLGNRTLRACAFLAWVLGLSGRRYKAISPSLSYKPHLSEALQRILRDSSKRSALDRSREKLRKGKVEKIRKAHSEGPAAAIAFIRKLAAEGVHEVGETNTGPWVDKFEALFGLHAVAWCGMLAGWVAIKIGHCVAKDLSFWNGYALITEAAQGKDGCYEVGFDQIEGGEILVYWGGEHVGTALVPSEGDDVEAGEGNTSPTDGNSQADGGAIAVKTRSRSDVSCAIRIYG